MFNRSIVAVALILTLIASGTRASGPLVILDTDYRSDVDDVGALAMMHALQDRGEGTLIGVIGTTSGPNIAASIDAVNTYYGRSTIPVGLVTNPPSPTPGSDDFTPALANPLRYASQQTNATAPNSTALYRQLLNQAPDNSVKIVVVGGQTAVSRLLDSPANDNNDGINLTGKQLIASKVSQLVVMGGRFSSGNKSEFNINLDVTSANNVANNWTSPVVYSGFEVGVNVKTGAGLTNQKNNPIAQAYDLYRGTDGGKGTVGDRSSWDQTAVLYAVRGTHSDGTRLWNLSDPTGVQFSSGGKTNLLEPPPNHQYLINAATNAQIAAPISQLMLSAPANPGPGSTIQTFARWTPNAGAGTQLNDQSTRGQHGTLINFNSETHAGDSGPSGWTSNGRLRFDGVDDYVATGFSLADLRGGSFTAEVVLAYEGTANRDWTPILGSSKAVFDDNQIFFIGKNKNNTDLQINLAGLATYNISATGLFDGQEHHLAVVFDDTANQIRTYVNEELIHTRNDVTWTSLATSDLLLGAVGHSSTERWAGLLGSARFHAEALGPGQFIPEPTSLALLAAGGLVMLPIRARRVGRQ